LIPGRGGGSEKLKRKGWGRRKLTEGGPITTQSFRKNRTEKDGQKKQGNPKGGYKKESYRAAEKNPGKRTGKGKARGK